MTSIYDVKGENALKYTNAEKNFGKGVKMEFS